MKTINLLVTKNKNLIPRANLKPGCFYLINHTLVEDKGHTLSQKIIFVDYDRNAHSFLDNNYASGMYWTGEYCLDVVKELENMTLTVEI